VGVGVGLRHDGRGTGSALYLQSGLVSLTNADRASESRRFSLRRLRSPPGREWARPMTVWAGSVRANASNTAVPRTPDAPWVKSKVTRLDGA